MNDTNAVRALRARPVALLAALIILASVGNALLAGCGGSGGSSSSEQPPASGSTEGGDMGSSGAADTGMAAATGEPDGAKIYSEKCALCHGATGHGDGPASAALNPKPRNHTDGAYMNSRTNDELLDVIRNGKGAMPPWGSVLSDKEIHAVLKHVRSLAVPPYEGPPVSDS